MVGLDKIDAVLDALARILRSFRAPECVGENLDAPGVASVDEIFGKDRPVGVERVRAHAIGRELEACGIAQGGMRRIAGSTARRRIEVFHLLINDGSLGQPVPFQGRGQWFGAMSLAST